MNSHVVWNLADGGVVSIFYNADSSISWITIIGVNGGGGVMGGWRTAELVEEV